MPTLADRFKAAARGFRMVHGGEGGTLSGQGGANYAWPVLPAGAAFDYEREAGDPWRNSAVAIALGWIRRNAPQARICVRRTGSDGTETEVRRHALTELVRRPNDFYKGRDLIAATALSLVADGNAYWLKARADGVGKPLELWYVPHWQIFPLWPRDGSEFISGYEYRTDGGRTRVELARAEVIHFRNGLDPANLRLGNSDVRNVIREVYSDNEASSYTAAILRNCGVISWVMAPKDNLQNFKEGERERLKAHLKAETTGENRGGVIMPSIPVSIDSPAFSPEQLALDKLRQWPEARILAAIGIPGMVLGLSVGDSQRTYSNMGEAHEWSWENCLMPLFDSLAEQLEEDLLPDLGKPEQEEVRGDYSKVRALSQDEDELYQRFGAAYSAGWITRAEARTGVNQKAAKGIDDVYFVPGTGALVPAEADIRDQPEPQAPQALATGQPDAGAPESSGDAGAPVPEMFGGSVPASKSMALPLAVRVSESDIEHAVTVWRDAMPERFAGLLDAKPAGAVSGNGKR